MKKEPIGVYIRLGSFFYRILLDNDGLL